MMFKKNIYKIITSIVLILTFFTSSDLVVAQSIKKDEWHLYTSSKAFGLKMDGYRLTDTVFKLKIAEQPIKTIDISGGINGFIHILEFNKNQKIVTIYNPNKNDKSNFSELDISFNKLKDISKRDNIYIDLCNRIKFLKSRRFGIVKLEELGFYIIYVNVKKSNTATFDYSLNSLKL
jgi:hypothetical protein